MHADASLAGRIAAAIGSIPSPAAPVATILERAQRVRSQPLRRPAAGWRGAAVAAGIAVALGAASLPLVAPGAAQTMEARIAQFLGWTPPPPPPHTLDAPMRPHVVTLEAARRSLPFPLVVPTGLPGGVAGMTIYEAKTGLI